MTATPNLNLDLLPSNPVDGHIPHNEALANLDAVVQLSVISRTTTSPPAGSEGDRYIVGPSATGDWAGEDGNLAYYINGGWTFYTPKEGWRAWVEDEQVHVQYAESGGIWSALVGTALFAAYRAGAGQGFTGSWVALQWDTQIDMATGVYTHDTGSNPEQITLKEAGRYLVTLEVTAATSSGSGTNNFDTKLTLDTVDVAGSFAAGRALSTTDRATVTSSIVIVASANQVLRAEVSRAAGAQSLITVPAYTRITIQRINH